MYPSFAVPADNAHTGSCSGVFQVRRLSRNLFMYPENAKEKLERWRSDYNEYRPYSVQTYFPQAGAAGIHTADVIMTSFFKAETGLLF